MKKVRLGAGVFLMVGAMLVSDSAGVLLIYWLCALLHEIGHLVAARILRIGIKEIRFGFSGVRIVTDERLTSYRGELLLSLAGPAANALVFAAATLLFCGTQKGFEGMFLYANIFLSSGDGGIFGIVGFMALSSLVQAFFNLLPVNSFDGGRVIYCAAAQHLSAPAAERIIDVTTALSAFLLWTLALYLMLRISNGLGIFIFAVCIFVSGLVNERQSGKG